MRPTSTEDPTGSRPRTPAAILRALILVPLVPLAAIASRCPDHFVSEAGSGSLLGQTLVTEEEGDAGGRTRTVGYYRMGDGSTLKIDCSHNTSSGSVMLGTSV